MMVWGKIPWKQIEDYVEESVGQTFDTIFATLDGIEGDVKAQMDKDLQKNLDKLADEIIADSSKKTGAIGAGAAVPDLIPVGGWPVLIASIGTDFTLTLREELSMLSKLAYLYGQDRSQEIRKREAVALLAAVRAADDSTRGNSAEEVGKLMAMMGAKHISRKMLVQIAKEIAKRFYKRKLLAVVPVLGIGLSGGVNYYSTRALGDRAKRYYQNRQMQNPEVENIASEIQHFQRCYLQILVNMAKVDKNVPPEESEFLHDAMMMFGCTAAEQDAYRADLEDREALKSVSLEDLRRLSLEDRNFILKQAIAMMLVSGRTSRQEKTYLEKLKKDLGVDGETASRLETEAREELAEDRAVASGQGVSAPGAEAGAPAEEPAAAAKEPEQPPPAA